MKLKLLAPVRTDFSIVSDLPIRDPERYADLWRGAKRQFEDRQQQLGKGPLAADVQEVRFLHTENQEPYNRYQRLDTHSLERSLHVLEVHLNGSAFAAQSASELAEKIEWVLWRVFDHGISLLEANVSLGDGVSGSSAEQVPEALDRLQQQGIALAEELARSYAYAVLSPLFDGLREESGQDDPYVEASLGAKSDHGRVLWVTRTLIFEPGDAEKHRGAVVRHWLKDSSGIQAQSTSLQEMGQQDDSQLEPIVGDPRQYLTRWLNYLFREQSYPEAPNADRAQAFCDPWEAMLHAQYFYGALDIVDTQLTEILARAQSREDLRIDDLKQLLEKNIRKANHLLLQLHDSGKYFKRTVKGELDAILESWDFEAALIQPVERKIDLCQDRLALLHQKEISKSAFYTDAILLGIGVTSIFGTALALADYGRTMATDADLASYDVNSWNFIDRFAALPTDIVLAMSFFLSLLLVVLFSYFRKRQTV